MHKPCRARQGAGYEACGDDGAPGVVEQRQLDELHIACICERKTEE